MQKEFAKRGHREAVFNESRVQKFLQLSSWWSAFPGEHFRFNTARGNA